MYDQLIIGNKASVDDFDASLAARAISAPAKKSIKETVPFSNKTYDFSAINGEVYWNERTLEYVFEIVADTPYELECKKAAFSDWIMNVMEEEIFDPYEPGWHYVGTYEDMSYEDDESIEKTTATVTFTAYPYKIANKPTVCSIALSASGAGELKIINESSHRLVPVLTASAAVQIISGGKTYDMAAGEVVDDSFMVQAGANSLTIINQSTETCEFSVKFHREVF